MGVCVKEGGRAARVADATLSKAETRPGLENVLILGPRNMAAAFRGAGDGERERLNGEVGGPGA